MSDKDSEELKRDFDMCSNLHSHASRIHSSSFIALYTILLGYLVFFYTVLQNRGVIHGNVAFLLVFTIMDLGILGLCLSLFLRHVAWRNLILRIEKEKSLCFSNGKTFKDRIDEYLYGEKRGFWFSFSERQKWRGMTMGDIAIVIVVSSLAIANLSLIVYFFSAL